MAKPDYTALIEQLGTISNPPSDNGNRRGYRQAKTVITDSQLNQSEQEVVLKALSEASDNNQGYYYNSNGVHGAIKAIETLEAANDDNFDPEPPEPLTVAKFYEMAKDGRVFGVSFVKRTTGELRTMTARLGVKKFLRGGKLSYSPADKQLLTVFDMAAKGYRAIPLDGVTKITLSGKPYTLEV